MNFTSHRRSSSVNASITVGASPASAARLRLRNVLVFGWPKFLHPLIPSPITLISTFQNAAKFDFNLSCSDCPEPKRLIISFIMAKSTPVIMFCSNLMKLGMRRSYVARLFIILFRVDLNWRQKSGGSTSGLVEQILEDGNHE